MKLTCCQMLLDQPGLAGWIGKHPFYLGHVRCHHLQQQMLLLGETLGSLLPPGQVLRTLFRILLYAIVVKDPFSGARGSRCLLVWGCGAFQFQGLLNGLE